jgi:signal transduction histidine kinase
MKEGKIAKTEKTRVLPRVFNAIRGGLSTKLLVLTAIFVLVAEILIFVPSVANFRNGWLKDHLLIAEAASIVYLDSTDLMLSEEAGQNLLATTSSLSVAIRRDGISRLMAKSPGMGELVEHIDLDNTTAVGSIVSSLRMLFDEPDSQYRVFGTMRSTPAIMELVQETRYIQKAMWVYARNVAILSLLISVFTAALVYLALYRLIVLPIIRISSNMDAFSKTPENASLVYKPTTRIDEIGTAEKRLAAFQGDLQQTLRQKQRLADLGLAVSKINHDLRNILASAQLFSDRLSALPDPTVQRFAPKLIKTIDRAVDYTKSVIDYGRALEAPPKRRKLLLNTIANDVADMLGLENSLVIEWNNNIPLDFQADADPEQLFRVLMNLCRNAQQAMIDADLPGRAKKLTIQAEHLQDEVHIRITDTGPGIPENIQEKIFIAFEGSTKAGGSGLGMAIAVELLRAHGGTIEIENTDENGTTFHIVIPNEYQPQ